MMLRFVLAILIIAVVLKVSQDDPYIGFGIWAMLTIAFFVYALNRVDQDDLDFEKRMNRTPKNRKKLFYLLNAQ